MLREIEEKSIHGAPISQKAGGSQVQEQKALEYAQESMAEMIQQFGAGSARK
jgi:hypothetical protein